MREKRKSSFIVTSFPFLPITFGPIFPMLCLRSMSQAGAGTGTHQVKLIQMFGNSIYLTIILTVLEVFVSACTAYVITYYRFPGRKIIYGMVIFTMVVPLVGTLPVSYDFFSRAKLLNTIPGMIFAVC